MGMRVIFMKGDKAKWDVANGRKDRSLQESGMCPW